MWVFRTVLTVDIPKGADHTVHLYHSWFMSHRLLPLQDAVTGWSHLQFAGYPAFSLYAPGPYILIAGLHYLGFSLSVSYNVVLAGVWLGLPLALYALLRAHSVDIFASCVAALIVLVDPGAYNEGGWIQVIEQGVWTGTLALVMSLIALLALRYLMLSRSVWGLVWVAVAVGLSLLLHPVSIIILGISALLYVLIMSASLADIGRASVAGLFGLGLSAWWIWPFINAQADLIPHGQGWLSFTEISTRLWKGTLFINGSALLLVAGLYAGIMMWRLDKRFHTYGVVLICVFLLIASDDTWAWLGLSDTRFYEQINLHRLVAPARVAWWCFAAIGITQMWRRIPWKRLTETPVVSSILVFVFALISQPLIYGFLAEVKAPSQRLGAVVALDYHQDLMDVLEHLNTLDAIGPVGRVMVREPRDVHCAQWVPVITGRPIAHPGGKPTFHYRRRFYHHAPDVLRAQGVEWILTCRSGPQVRGAKRVYKQGDVALWSLPRPSENPIRLTGDGKATLVEWDVDKVVVNVERSNGPVTVTLPVVAHDRWKASANGQPIHIVAGALHDDAVPYFISATVNQPGAVVFEYSEGRFEGEGRTVSFGSLGLLFVILGASWFRKRSKPAHTC